MNKKFSISITLITIIAIAILIFLYFPIVVVGIYSFNADKVNSFPMQGISLKWYEIMFKDTELITALGNSIIVAIISTTIAILLGVPGAYAMYKNNFWGKEILNRMVMLPLILPGILTGIALLTFFKAVGIRQSMLAVVLGHSTFLIATVLPQIYSRLRRFDPYILEASTDLGASSFQTFIYVILPNIKTAILGAALLSITLSLDEIPVTYFLNGIFQTLPIQIWGMTRNGITPEVNAISTLIFVVSLIIILASNILESRGDKANED